MKQLNMKITVITTVIVLAVIGVIIAFAAGPKTERHQTNENLPADQSAHDEEDTPFDEDSNKDELDKIKPLAEDTISVLAVGVDKSEKLTDVIMYAMFDTKAKTVSVLRIPRDCFVGSAFPTGKINAIYGHPTEGKTEIETLQSYLEDNWKLDIDYHVIISLDAVKDIIDDLGGITMNVEQTINYLPGQVLYPGVQVLDGEKSEWILRYRAGYSNGDIGRIDMQSKFLGACIDTAKQKGMKKCLSVLMKNYKEINTDMTLDKMIAIATNYYDIDKDDMKMHVVPGSGGMYYSYAVYAVDKTGLLEILNENFVTDGTELTTEDLDIPSLPASNYNYYPGNNGTNQGQQDSQWEQFENNEGSTDFYDEDGNYIGEYYDENGNLVQNDRNSNWYTNNSDDSQDYQNSRNSQSRETNDPEENADQEDEPGIIRRKDNDFQDTQEPEEKEKDDGPKVIRKKDHAPD